VTLMDHDPLLAAVSGVLGEPVTAASLVATLHERRMNYLARGLHYRIARCADPRDTHACQAAIEALSEAAAARLLRSPTLCERLRTTSTDAQLRALLEHAEFEADAPRLRCGLPVDLSLPAILANPDAGLQRPRALEPAELAAAIVQLDSAVECLGAVYPPGHHVFTELTSNLVLRVDEARPDECWGATSGIAIGRTAVINPAAAHDPAALAEVLLHEATHCALDCAELDRMLVVLDAEAFARKVPSPWTGALLYPHAFAHASVVWAVLLRFWAEYSARHPDHEHARVRSRFIRRGFMVGDLPATLSVLGEHLTAAAPAVITDAWAAARRMPADPG